MSQWRTMAEGHNKRERKRERELTTIKKLAQTEQLAQRALSRALTTLSIIVVCCSGSGSGSPWQYAKKKNQLLGLIMCLSQGSWQ